ncbi:unnamed protein product [Arctogadus glacialis]
MDPSEVPVHHKLEKEEQPIAAEIRVELGKDSGGQLKGQDVLSRRAGFHFRPVSEGAAVMRSQEEDHTGTHHCHLVVRKRQHGHKRPVTFL